MPAPTLELIRGPRTRTGLVSGALVAAVKKGLTVTVGGLVAMFTTFEAARLKSIARRWALVDAKVGVMVSGWSGSKVTLIVCVVTAFPVVSTTFALVGTPPTMTEIFAFV